MRFTLEIEMGNEAMRSPHDVADAVARVAEQLLGAGDGWDVGNVFDRNGNNVGEWAFRGEVS